MADQEDECEVHILAAGIGQQPGDSSSDPNKASIVTLIRVHGRKILLTGDAETATEDFLLERHADWIKDVDILHVEHHGAGTTSHAGKDFVKKVNPRLAIISVGKLDNNPRWDLIEKYVDGTRLSRDVEPHLLEYGYGDAKRCTIDACEWSENYKKRGIYTTQTSGDLLFSIARKGGVITRRWSQSRVDYGFTIDGAGTVADIPGTLGRATGV